MTNSSSLIPVPIPIVELKEDTNSSSSSKKSLVYQFFTYKSSRYYCNYCPKEKIGEMDKFVISNQKENETSA
ncbi:hypothetical protein RhiirB3_446925 [Rhizophagus irregularis]|nr:hypothetical protein RhiirB3_446925 [Rhizophagus irregularis]